MKLALGGGGAPSGAARRHAAMVDGVKLIAGASTGSRRARCAACPTRSAIGSAAASSSSRPRTTARSALVVSVTKDLTARVQAGQLVKELAPIVGGGGGGRPDFAEAGGKDPSKIDELLAAGARGPAELLSLQN